MRLIRSSESGFTLIEIMIVVLIIGILMAVAVPNFLKARESSRAKTCQTNLRQIDTAKEHWAMENGKTSLEEPTSQELITEYMRARYEDELPACPSGGSYEIGNMVTLPTCSISVDGEITFDSHVIQ